MSTAIASRPVTIPKNSREELRVSVDTFKGHRLLSLRVWFESDDGTMRPGKQGVAIRVELAADLAKAIQEVSHGQG